MNLLILFLLLGADAAPTQTWPGFRGDGSSTSTAKNLPLTWLPTENLAWRTPLPGYGQSSPVVWGDRAFVTAVDGDQKEKPFVVDLAGCHEVRRKARRPRQQQRLPRRLRRGHRQGTRHARRAGWQQHPLPGGCQ